MATVQALCGALVSGIPPKHIQTLCDRPQGSVGSLLDLDDATNITYTDLDTNADRLCALVALDASRIPDKPKLAKAIGLLDSLNDYNLSQQRLKKHRQLYYDAEASLIIAVLQYSRSLWRKTKDHGGQARTPAVERLRTLWVESPHKKKTQAARHGGQLF